MTKRKPAKPFLAKPFEERVPVTQTTGRSPFTVDLPLRHAATLRVWASEKDIDASRLAALLLCLAIEEWEETGKLQGASLKLSGERLENWLRRRLAGELYGGGTDLDDGIPF